MGYLHSDITKLPHHDHLVNRDRGSGLGSVPDLRKLFNLQEIISIQHVRIGLAFSFRARFLDLRDSAIDPGFRSLLQRQEHIPLIGNHPYAFLRALKLTLAATDALARIDAGFPRYHRNGLDGAVFDAHFTPAAERSVGQPSFEVRSEAQRQKAAVV